MMPCSTGFPLIRFQWRGWLGRPSWSTPTKKQNVICYHFGYTWLSAAEDSLITLRQHSSMNFAMDETPVSFIVEPLHIAYSCHRDAKVSINHPSLVNILRATPSAAGPF